MRLGFHGAAIVSLFGFYEIRCGIFFIVDLLELKRAEGGLFLKRFWLNSRWD